MTKKYILQDGQPKEEENVQVWAQWFETADRRIAYTEDSRGYVSTVFLGLDHNFLGGAPLLYETMIFCPGLKCDQEQFRYATRREAKKGHAQAVTMMTRAAPARREGEDGH